MTKQIVAYEVYCDGCGVAFGEFAPEHPDYFRTEEDAIDTATSFDGGDWCQRDGKLLCPKCENELCIAESVSDFQQWQDRQVSPSDSWNDVPDPDKWLRDVRGYEDEPGKGRG